MAEKKLSSGKRKVRSRKQEEDDYCGPAVAQMTLGGLGITRTQDRLWDAIQDEFQNQGLAPCEPCFEVPCSPWSTRPEALQAVLDRLANVQFKLVSNTTVAPTDHAIVWSVTNDVASCVLIEGWRHWVVVYGYKVDRVPANAADTGYVLDGFHLRDPAQSEPATRFVTAAHWRSAVPHGRAVRDVHGQVRRGVRSRRAAAERRPHGGEDPAIRDVVSADGAGGAGGQGGHRQGRAARGRGVARGYTSDHDRPAAAGPSPRPAPVVLLPGAVRAQPVR